MNKETTHQAELATVALAEIAEGLQKAVSGVDRLREALVAVLKAQGPEPVPEPEKPVREAALATTLHRARLGDVGFAADANPVRQAVGQAGGLATAGVQRAPCPDRRAKGTVNVKDMDVNEKRRYWRWSKDRARCRAAGAEPVSWDKWVAGGDALVVENLEFKLG